MDPEVLEFLKNIAKADSTLATLEQGWELDDVTRWKGAVIERARALLTKLHQAGDGR